MRLACAVLFKLLLAQCSNVHTEAIPNVIVEGSLEKHIGHGYTHSDKEVSYRHQIDYMSASQDMIGEEVSLAQVPHVSENPVTSQFASFGSSILAALSLTVVTELGDRTFFVAAMLAAQYSKWKVWLGASSALWVQTLGCALVGAFFHRWQFKSQWMRWPIDDYIAGLVLTVFGIMHIREGLGSQDKEAETLEVSPSTVLLETGKGERSEGKRRASVSSSSRRLEQARKTLTEVALPSSEPSIVARSFWLVMVAEIGDRSMFSTIALAAAQNWIGVAIGAAVGHSFVTCVAVTCAALLGQILNERVTNILGGLLFLAFGLLSITEGLIRQGVL
eukprot:Blabericola_migrator_1__2432@NODE_1685_length_4002_cov_97_585260_g1092_i0_p2_GENE_NODE_1685_length_4002_cov_97_585260_g1092_i0NODE_1685_length_4002_cov_97_585260_g1092_i0_p2_ORF_typecomplete_len333_score61_47UPF0016/PF01169_19/2_9e15UPF0016/PF01169_19/1_2e20Mntp/PF02659_15/0_0057LysE/PF01810_18/0_0015CRCB/PF02537_15/0_31_NODE_1685_length_4002_cov_97_585260_g1092_i08171815